MAGSSDVIDYMDVIRYLKKFDIEPDIKKMMDEVDLPLHQKINGFLQAVVTLLGAGPLSHSSPIDIYMIKSMFVNYVLNPLSADGSLYRDGRFNRRDWTKNNVKSKCFYLAPDEDTARAEILTNEFEVKSPRAQVWVNVSLRNVFDCPGLEGKFPFLKIISTENWSLINNHTESFTQLFGLFLANAGFSAIRYRSAQMDEARYNLCLFPENLSSNESITVVDQHNVYGKIAGADKRLLALPYIA